MYNFIHWLVKHSSFLNHEQNPSRILMAYTFITRCVRENLVGNFKENGPKVFLL